MSPKLCSKQLFRTTLIAAVLCTALPALAQTPPPAPPPATPDTRSERDVQRDVNQQQRIDAGLKGGALSQREAANLERQEAHIDQAEKRDMRNGSISTAEQQRLTAEQNRVSQEITADKHNAYTGNGHSASAQRLESDVQRDTHQEQRIESGLQGGALNNRQAGQLERGQAYDDRREAHAAGNGHVSANEQAHMNRAESRQSQRIHDKKTGG